MNDRQRISGNQELHIARKVGGMVTPNSGGTKFGGGDILTDKFFIEAKTSITPKESFSIKLSWIYKAQEQAFEQGKEHAVLAFQFKPYGNNYYILSEQDFVEYVRKEQPECTAEACEDVAEVLKKQIPREPCFEGDGYADGQIVYDTWICPCCGKDYEVDYDNYNYCPNCGQRIDWFREGK